MLGPGGTDADDDIYNYMDYSLNFCWRHFTPGQFERMRALVGQYRAGLVNGDGATVRYDRSITVASNQNWAWYGANVRFPASEGYTVYGGLTSSNATFGPTDAAQGWDGFRFESGASGSLSGPSAGSTVEGVKQYGGAALYVLNADLTLDGATITGSTLGSGAAGVYATGSSAYVHVKNGSFIKSNEGRGIYAGNGADVYVEESFIEQNNGDGVYAGNADVFLYDSEVKSNGGYGTRAHYFGNVVFGIPFSGYPTPNQNNLLTQNSTGTLAATSYADLSAGSTPGDFSQNDFYRQSSQLHAYARTSSDVRAQCDFWGSTSGPNLSYVNLDGSSTFTYVPYLIQSGGNCGTVNARSSETPGVASVNGIEGDETPSGFTPLVWQALQAADAGDFATAAGLLRRAIRGAESQADRERAYAVVTRLMRRVEPELLVAFLEGRRSRVTERPWVLLALAEAHLAAGDAEAASAAASALTEENPEGAHGLFGYAILHRLALTSGDVSAAEAVLTSAEVGWPDAEVTALMQSEHAAWLGEEPAGGARSAPTPLAAVAAVAPEAYALEAPYPNPTDGSVTVPFRLADEAEVTVEVLDVLGRRVAVLLRERLPAGQHEAVLDAAHFAPGLYLLRAEVQTDAGDVRLLQQQLTVVH